MIKIISLDMDGTLVKTEFVDKVWMEGMPSLYAERHGLEFHQAKEYVIGEYMRVGSDHLDWYDLQYWLDKFKLTASKEDVLELYLDEVEAYPEVKEALKMLSESYQLVVTSNASREFIDIELSGLQHYFSDIFSATSDFKQVKKSPLVYQEVCRRMGVKPLEVLHIGDHYTYDYESPLEAGLDALFLDRHGNRKGSEVVGDLREAALLVCGCSISDYPNSCDSDLTDDPDIDHYCDCNHDHSSSCDKDHSCNCK
jgi:HAD superfamily hydrolase (TIGR01549 family)